MGSIESIHFDIIIIGAGPVGLLTAINVAKAGVKVLVLEQGEGIDQSPRATSYQPCVMAEMQESGVLDDVKKKAMINDVLSFWVGSGPEKEQVALIKKVEGGNIFPAGLNCGQPVLAGVILDHLLSRYNAEVRFKQKVTELEQSDRMATVVCINPDNNKSTVYTCNWLVGADGAGSTVRRLLDIKFEGFSWPKEDFCATNVRYPFDKHGFTTANFVLHPVNWAVITVIDSTGLWRCAFGVKAGLTNDEIRAELDDHYKHIFPGWPGEGYELVQLNKYKPHQRCAGQYRKGRCFLAGDAAHSNNPIGGLGLTTGLLDAGPLGRALGAVVLGKAPESLLDVWAKARREKWLTFTNAFSIENKRMVQRGGYSDDPLGIWVEDDISAKHGMNAWVRTAHPGKEEQDLELFEALKNGEAQMANRMRQWKITLDPLWMAEYEDPEVVKYRMSLRPAGAEVTPIEE